MNELERIEAQALRESVLLMGGRAELVGGASCVAHPVPMIELNRALVVGEGIDVDAIASWYGSSAYVIQTTATLELERRGAWTKFERDASPAPAVATDLRVEETDDAAAFVRASNVFAEAVPAVAELVGAPGWHCFVGWADGEPAAAGALFVDGGSGWIGVASTRPEFRRRGGQGALLAARIDAARTLGVTVLATETGERAEGRPSTSYDNIVRAGFREAYVRPNWAPRA